MIKDIFFDENTTYITDIQDIVITTNNLSFSDAFDFARNNLVDFDYNNNLSDEDIDDINSYFFNLGHRDIGEFLNQLLNYEIIDLNTKRMYNEIIISEIIRTYNEDIRNFTTFLLLNGTDTTIKLALSDMLTADSSLGEELLAMLPNGIRSLDEVVKKASELYEKNNSEVGKLQKEFAEAYDKSSEAIEDYIEYAVTYGGDYSHKIYLAMQEVFDAINEEKMSTDKNGLIYERRY